MKRLRALIGVLLVITFVLAACAQPAPVSAPSAAAPAAAPTSAPGAKPTTAPAAQPAAGGGGGSKTLVIGFTTSQTGSLTKESKEQVQGLQLWLADLEKAGGLKLKDGTAIKFQFKSYDDESTKDRVQQLYTKLSTEDKADFLISPYSSGLADAAAVVAEQYNKVMIVAGASSDGTFQKGFQNIYMIYTPASRYLTGAVDALKAWDANAKKVAIIHENEKFSTDVVNAAKPYAEKQGFQITLFEGYDTGTADFGPLINKITGGQPDAIIGGGHFQDGSTLAKQLLEKKAQPKMVAILVAPSLPEFAQLGDSAIGIVGPSQWETLAKYSTEAAKAAGVTWYGPSVATFVDEYKAKYGYEPGYHAAGGYATGLLFQKAIEDGNSTDSAAVKAALDKSDLMTFYGRIKFDTGKAHGLQLGHDMVYLQWQKGADGKPVRQIVWPAAAKTADAIYPLGK
ncbi:MAG TPA: amino acid ABC transporter substrate-binding protein [Anaerolineae bacterium]